MHSSATGTDTAPTARTRHHWQPSRRMRPLARLDATPINAELSYDLNWDSVLTGRLWCAHQWCVWNCAQQPPTAGRPQNFGPASRLTKLSNFSAHPFNQKIPIRFSGHLRLRTLLPSGSRVAPVRLVGSAAGRRWRALSSSCGRRCASRGTVTSAASWTWRRFRSVCRRATRCGVTTSCAAW